MHKKEFPPPRLCDSQQPVWKRVKSRGFGGSAHPNAKPFSFPAPPAHPSVLRCWNKTEGIICRPGSSEGNFAPSGNSPDPQVWCQHIPAPRSVPGTKGCPFPRAPLESVETTKMLFLSYFFYFFLPKADCVPHSSPLTQQLSFPEG